MFSRRERETFDRFMEGADEENVMVTYFKVRDKWFRSKTEADRYSRQFYNERVTVMDINENITSPYYAERQCYDGFESPSCSDEVQEVPEEHFNNDLFEVE